MPPEIKSPEGKAFVKDVMRRVGAAKPRDLSRMLGWDSTDRETRLYAWARGESVPNFDGTIALLRIAGLLREDEEKFDSRPPVRLPADRLGELEATIEREGKATNQAIRALAKEVRALARAPGAQAQ